MNKTRCQYCSIVNDFDSKASVNVLTHKKECLIAKEAALYNKENITDNEDGTITIKFVSKY